MTRVARSVALLAGLLGAILACERGQGRPDLPPAVLGQQRFEDPRLDFSEPDLAVASDGTVALVWIAFDGGRDRIQAALHRDGRWSEPFLVADDQARCFAPRVAAMPDGRFVVVWAAGTGPETDVYAALLDPGAGGRPVRVSEAPGPDTEPQVAVTADGTVWVTWQARREGRSDVYARRAREWRFEPELAVSDHPASDVQPALAVAPDGSVWAAWSSWRDGRYADGNYEIYARRLDAPGAPIRVSTSPRTDMLPSLVPAPDGLFVVWTEAAFQPIRVGEMAAVAYDDWADKTFQVARLVDGTPGPPRVLRLSPEVAAGSVASIQPRALPGPGGRGLWLLYGDRIVRGGFDRPFRLALARIGAQRVNAPIDLSAGMVSAVARYAAGWSGATLWLADEIDVVAAPGTTPRAALRVRSIDPQLLTPRAPIPTWPRQARVAVDPVLALDGGGEPRPAIEVEARTLRAYYGNLHLHSDFSGDRRGFEGRPQDNLQIVHDLARLDFAALADHAESLREVDWWSIRKLTDLWNHPGEFVTLPGYEWTSLDYGHRNVFFPDTETGDQAARFEAPGRTPEDLWRHLAERRALVIPHHPSHAFARPVDWSYRNDHFQRLVEIFQKRGSYEYDGAPVADIRADFVPGHSVRHALAQGHRLGIIASPDHGGGLGLAGAWAEDLSREALFEALHARRTFGTTGPRMALFLRIEGAPQGSEIPAPAGPVHIRAEVDATVPGLELTLVRDGVELPGFSFPGARAELDWVDPERPDPTRTRYYYLRARQADGHLGWTSPIWLAPAAAP